MRVGFVWGFMLAAALLPAAAGAGKPARPQGVKLLAEVRPAEGFVDDAFALDGAGGRLAWIRTDGSAYAELHVVDLGQTGKPGQNAATVAQIDLGVATTSAEEVRFVLDGSKLFLRARPPGAEKATAFLVDLTGKVLHQWGPATDVVLADVAGTPAAVVFDRRTRPDKGETVYDVSAYALGSGKALGKRRTFVADPEGWVKALDLRILYWRDGYTTLVAKKRGEYDKKLDQRLNDSEALYSVLEGKVIRSTMPKDVVAWLKLVKLREERPNTPAFVIVDEQRAGLELVTVDDRRVKIKLPVDFYLYEPTSLRQELGRDGKLYFTLTVDPVNPAALARKKADPEHIDLFVVDLAGDGTARRLARAARADRDFRWTVAGGRWVLLRKHKGFDRGGTHLEVYELTHR